VNSVLFIAEIAQAHDGSLGIAHSYIEALATTGVDVVKFQTHIAEAESSSHEQFRVKFSYEDNSRFDYWQRMEFNLKEWQELKNHCDEVGLEFMSSPFSCAAVDLLEEVGVKRYKIGSGELQNYLMLEKIAKTGKPIILSSGMSDWGELEDTICFLKPYGNELSLLQCTTAYPTQPQEWGLATLSEMKKRFNVPIGFSDHSSTPVAGIAAAALGAEILEFHAVFDKTMFGPDAKASLTIQEIKRLVDGVKMVTTSLNSSYNKENSLKYSELKTMFGKSLAVNKNLKKGHSIQVEDLESKKPGAMGIPAKEYSTIIGKKINCDLNQWDFLKEDFFD
jgi:N,N'-diacetyllegionaminate synthase